jgi:malonyl-CoA O-methyltransferase
MKPAAPTGLFDARQVRRAFARASASYATAATLQREVEARLLESLDLIALDRTRAADWQPGLVLDVGSGPGHAAQAMRRRWPKARIVAIDLALPMLRAMPSGWNPLRRRVDRVCADLRALPLAEGSVDVLFSNLCLQWVEDLPAAFAGFRDPVLDRDLLQRGHPDLPALMRELRAIGATNALQGRRHTLTGRGRFRAAAEAYEPLRGPDGLLPASWEVISALAWAPDPGAPIREGGGEIASFPADRIPIRRRG